MTPQGDVDLLSCNPSGGWVHELRKEFPEFWLKEGTDGPELGWMGAAGVFRLTLWGPKTLPSLDSKVWEAKAAFPVPPPERDSDMLVFFPLSKQPRVDAIYLLR